MAPAPRENLDGRAILVKRSVYEFSTGLEHAPMNPAVGAPLVVTAIALGVEGTILVRTAPREDRTLVAGAILATLPMCFVAYHLVRMPLDHVVERLTLGHFSLLSFLRMFGAPLTEEPAKLWPLLLPFFRRRITSRNAVHVGAALGLGFGVGEAWFVAGMFLGAPSVELLPWYALSGYVLERCLVCVVHGGATAMAIAALPYGGRRFALGVGLAMTFHFLTNFPIYLVSFAPLFKPLVGLWVFGAFGVALGTLLFLRGRMAVVSNPKTR
jgi:RsiW-degrading membrane proteinase PrsW (M82 family)